MQVYYGTYKILDWPYWFDVFILSFVILVSIVVIVYSLYKDQKDYNLNLELQMSCYLTRLQAEQSISNSLVKLRKEIQKLRHNKSEEKNKEISW